MKMSSKTKKLLKKSGWYEGMVFETGGYEKKLLKLGLPLHEAAKNFLRSFGGLYISYPNPVDPSLWNRFHFNAYKAAKGMHPKRLKSHEHQLGIQLSIIGTEAEDYILLMMDENGKVYADMDHVLYLVGESGIEAIENICQGKKMIKVE